MNKKKWISIRRLGLASVTLIGSMNVGAERILGQEQALNIREEGKSVVVEVLFSDLETAELRDIQIVNGVPSARAGNPPQLGVQVRNLEGQIVEEFDAWHPLYYVQITEGREERFVLEQASGFLAFPLWPQVATLGVTDLEAENFLLSVDVVPAIHAFCRGQIDDPDCEDIANRAPLCEAGGPYRAECAGPSTAVDVTLDGTTSSDPDEDPLSFLWSRASGGTAATATPTFQFAQIGAESVDLTVSDDWGGRAMCTTLVLLQDTAPPDVDVSVSPELLWPPNHKMVQVSVQPNASDTCDAAPRCVISGVASNEPVDGLGDGDTSPDWTILGPLSVELRAERAGNGSGRTYTIDVDCTDASGNSTKQTAQVDVPKNRGGQR